MNAAWKKIVRDFWRERTRTLLVVLAIALGIAGFSTVLSTYAILTRELDKGYLETDPASAVLHVDQAGDDLLAAILSDPRVSDAEPRRIVRGRIKAGPAEWRNLTLFVVKDYGDIRVSRLKPQKGAWPPGKGEILIERDAFQVARARIGDAVRVKTRDGAEQILRVSGSVHDVGQAQARMENIVYGYVTLETLEQLGEEPTLDRIHILVAENRFDEAHIQRVTADVAKVVEREGYDLRRVDIPRPGKHPHAELNGLLLIVIAGFGLFVLILSGVLVANLLLALMASQVRQIGVMKAIGGTRSQIIRIYLGQAVILGAAAILIGVPAGMWGSREFCLAMARFLNFDITSFAVPLWVYLLVAAVGLIIPLLAAAIPVWIGSGVTIREALADYGVSGRVFGRGALDRALLALKGPARPVLLAVRNGFRRRLRLVLTIITLACAGVFFMAALNVRASLIHTLDRMFGARKFDLSVTLGAPAPRDAVDRAIRKTPGIARAEGWITSEGSIPGAGEQRHAGPHGTSVEADRFTIVALPPETKLLEMNLADGRALQAGDTNAIVLNTALAAKTKQARAGNTIELRAGHRLMPWRVVGIVREPFSPPVAYVSRSHFEKAGNISGMTNSLRLVLDRSDAASIRNVETALDRNLEAEGVRAVGSMSQSDARFGFDQHMLMIYVFLVIMSFVIGGVGGLGLMTTMSLNVLERRREMGILRAIGATPRAVASIVVIEGVAIAVLSSVLAALIAWPVSKLVGDFAVRMMFRTTLDFSFQLLGLLIWLAISIALGALASFLPAKHASRGSVREALGYE